MHDGYLHHHQQHGGKQPSFTYNARGQLTVQSRPLLYDEEVQVCERPFAPRERAPLVSGRQTVCVFPWRDILAWPIDQTPYLCRGDVIISVNWHAIPVCELHGKARLAAGREVIAKMHLGGTILVQRSIPNRWAVERGINYKKFGGCGCLMIPRGITIHD